MFVVESLALVMCKSLDHQEVKLLKPFGGFLK